jgi:outer membrane protein TolC
MAVIATVIAVLTPTPTLVAQQQQPKASDAHVAELMKAALQQVNAGQTAQGTVQQSQGPAVDLRLEDAVGRAMDQNIDLAVARLNPQIQDLNLASTRAFYFPTLSGVVSDTNATSAGTKTTSGGLQSVTGTYQYNGTFSQSVPWYGGSATLRFTNSRQDTTDNTSLFNPTYQSTFSASYTQPLWRNLKIDSNRQSLWSGLINRQIADVTLRASVINTEASTRNAYWDLVFAVQNLDIQQRALVLAEQLVKDNQAKVEIGTLAPLDVVTAQSGAAQARQRVVAAEQTRQQNEISLKRLVVSSAQDPLWTSTINPVDRPEPPAQAAPIDLMAAIANALDKRTDLIQSRETLRQSEISLKYNKNLTAPQADLVASYSTLGTGGPHYQCTAYVGASCVSKALLSDGGYVQALGVLRQLKVPTWSFTLNFSYPIGTSAADANYARSRVQYQQSLTQLKSAELRVATDVTQAALNVRSNLQQVETARFARELAQKQLDAEQSKFEVGMQTNYFVVQAQQNLASAQVSELQALLNYRKSLVTFQQVQETGSASVGGVSSSSSSSSSSGSTGG